MAVPPNASYIGSVRIGHLILQLFTILTVLAVTSFLDMVLCLVRLSWLNLKSYLITPIPWPPTVQLSYVVPSY